MATQASQSSQSSGNDLLNVNRPQEDVDSLPPPPSVQFDLQMTIIPQQNHEDEQEEDASLNTWYTRREIRSFQIQTLRSAQELRELIQAGGGDGVTGRGEDICAFGIELLSSSLTVRRNIVSSQG
jgi:hypothetical protein